MQKKYTSLEEVPAEIKSKLSRFFSSVGRDTFVITGFPTELTGGALARYSRASTGMQLTIINEFLDDNGEPSQEKGSELMDRVLNAYGDDSVGELEGAHVGIENLSQLATKTIEDRRIGGSPIEQSTRYVKYDQKDAHGRWRYLRPKEVMHSPLAQLYEEVNDAAFEVYQKSIQLLSDYFKKMFPEDQFTIDVQRDGHKKSVFKHELHESEEKAFRTAYTFTIRCAALDVGRCVLPSSTLTHVGLFGNGRFFTNLITTLKSSELAEEQARGHELEKELQKTIPTFIKRNRANPDAARRNQLLRAKAHALSANCTPSDNYVTLNTPRNALSDTLAYAYYPYTSCSLQHLISLFEAMPHHEQEARLKDYVGTRESRRDRSGRGLEAGYPLMFDLVGCFAEYRDLQRHRMLTQQRQLLSTNLGFIMPPEMKEIGLETEVEHVVHRMEELNKKMRESGLLIASQYATLFNHRIRFCLGMNLRELQHLVELRTQPAGHFSYRAMTMEMARQASAHYPWMKHALEFVDYSDPGNKITRAKEQARIAGKNITSGISAEADLV